MPWPVMRMAPKPRRRTSRSPPMVNVLIAQTLPGGRLLPVGHLRGTKADEAFAQRLGALPEQGHVAQLDLLVAPDHVGQLEQLESGGVSLRCERCQGVFH